jgi:hypothetical protein
MSASLRFYGYTVWTTWGLGFDVDFRNKALTFVVGPFNCDLILKLGD